MFCLWPFVMLIYECAKGTRYGVPFSLFARHGRALTGVSPEHTQIVGSV